jgi:hypothetical protein
MDNSKNITKRELIKRLPKFLALSHGSYSTTSKFFIVPEKTVFIFLSKASRYLLQSVVDDDFYRFFGAERNYTKPYSPTNMPKVLEGWDKRVYGPGQRMRDITLQFSDPQWPGMGIHHLPIRHNQLKTTPGQYQGLTGELSSLKMPPSGAVIFIVACRGFQGQNASYSNQKANYKFRPNMPHAQLLVENKVSSSLTKRRRSENNNGRNSNTSELANNRNANTRNRNDNSNIMRRLLKANKSLRSTLMEGTRLQNNSVSSISKAWRKFLNSRRNRGGGSGYVTNFNTFVNTMKSHVMANN